MVPIVGVMGSGRREWTERARPLGELLARIGVHLLTGGGRGVMESVSRAFHNVEPRRGRIIGVLPGDLHNPANRKDGYPNPYVEIAIQTHLPFSGSRGEDILSRNHINVLSSDVIIALPGSDGTASEIRLAELYGRPVIAWIEHDDELPKSVRSIPRATTLNEIESFLRDHLTGRL